MKYSLVLWDYNGTIMDDVHAALGSVNDMLTKRGQPTIDIERYYSAIVTPIWGFYQEVFEPGSITMEEAIAEFASGCKKHQKSNPLMQGVEDTIRYLYDSGVRQAVVSSSNVDLITDSLRSLGIDNYFHRILGLSDFYVGDKVFLAKEYLEETDTDASKVLVIGDTLMDYQMSRELNCDCVLLSAGHQSKTCLLTAGVPVIDSLSELIKYVKE